MDSFRIKDDHGFSFIELIVVVLIIAIISAGATMALTSIYYADSERAAKKFAEYMTVARRYAMDMNTDDGSVDISLKVSLNSDENYYIGVFKGSSIVYPESPDNEDGEKLCKYRVTVKAGPENSTDQTAIAGNKSLEYTFKKATGGIKRAELNSVDCGQSGCSDVLFEGAEKYKVVIASAIGRCYVE